MDLTGAAGQIQGVVLIGRREVRIVVVVPNVRTVRWYCLLRTPSNLRCVHHRLTCMRGTYISFARRTPYPASRLPGCPPAFLPSFLTLAGASLPRPLFLLLPPCMHHRFESDSKRPCSKLALVAHCCLPTKLVPFSSSSLPRLRTFASVRTCTTESDRIRSGHPVS